MSELARLEEAVGRTKLSDCPCQRYDVPLGTIQLLDLLPTHRFTDFQADSRVLQAWLLLNRSASFRNMWENETKAAENPAIPIMMLIRLNILHFLLFEHICLNKNSDFTAFSLHLDKQHFDASLKTCCSCRRSKVSSGGHLSPLTQKETNPTPSCSVPQWLLGLRGYSCVLFLIPLSQRDGPVLDSADCV